MASRTVYGALGSDTGGSIRIPSAMCGVVGIKPTQTRVSRFGLMPLSFSFDCSGPLTRTVRDAARILHIIAGHDPKDSTSSRRKVPDYEAECKKEVAFMRLGIPSNYFYDDLDTDVDRLLKDTRKIFEGLKVEIVSVDVPSHDHINLIWAAALAAEASTIHRKWLRDRPGLNSEEEEAGVASEPNCCKLGKQSNPWSWVSCFLSCWTVRDLT